MRKFRSVNVDLEIYKKLVSEMLDTDRDENDVLHRLLSVPFSNGGNFSVAGSSGRDTGWSSQGVSLSEGAKLRFTRLGQEHHAEIRQGAIVTEAGHFHTASSAAEAVARTRSGAKPSLDGWRLWSVQLPETSEWVPLEDLRARAQGQPLRPKSKSRKKNFDAEF